MSLHLIVASLFADMSVYLKTLSKATYSQPLDLFSGASLGQHTRHILEFFQCLTEQAPGGTINYDARTRSAALEQDPAAAFLAMAQLQERLSNFEMDLPLQLETNFSLEANCPAGPVNSTFGRELVYNIEHTIHHLALIRIGLRAVCPGLTLPEGFGVAPSSLRYRRARTASLPPSAVASHA